MTLTVGSEVVVTTLGKKGRIVEAREGGRFRVVVGPMSVWCVEADLATVSQGKKKLKREREAPPPSPAEFVGPAAAIGAAWAGPPSEAEVRRLRSLDLHGMTVGEALHAVEARVDEAIRAGLDRVEIIHGISGGRLRAAVRGHLAGMAGISGFAADPKNAGVTWVYL